MSPQISVIEIDTTPMQDFQIFLLKRPPPMMPLLFSDVIAYDFSVGRADSRAVALQILARAR
jgi:hypothetical protein